MKALLHRHLDRTSPHHSVPALTCFGLLLMIPAILLLGVEYSPSSLQVGLFPLLAVPVVTAYALPLLYTHVLKRPWKSEQAEESRDVGPATRLGRFLAAPVVGSLLFGTIATFGAMQASDYVGLNEGAARTTGEVLYRGYRGIGSVTVEFEVASGELWRARIQDFGGRPYEGDGVTVEYDREDPTNARIPGKSDPLITGLFLTIVGGSFVVIITANAASEWRQRNSGAPLPGSPW